MTTFNEETSEAFAGFNLDDQAGRELELNPHARQEWHLHLQCMLKVPTELADKFSKFDIFDTIDEET